MKEELTIEQIQKASLEILLEIIKICKKLDLKYFLYYGTLIGVIRHQGFIPWDDDLDIMMPRNDYEILIQFFIDHKNAYKYLTLYEPRVNKNYPYMIGRISDNRYYLEVENEKDYGIGVFVDIYPFDGLGNTRKESLKFAKKGDRLSSLCYQATREKFVIGNTKAFFRKIIKYPVFIFSKIIGKEYFQRKLALLVGIKKYEESDYVGCIIWISGGERDVYKKEWLEETIELSFCNHMVSVPKKYDKILKNIYGDYMKLPSKEEQIGHHFYKAFLKNSTL